MGVPLRSRGAATKSKFTAMDAARRALDPQAAPWPPSWMHRRAPPDAAARARLVPGLDDVLPGPVDLAVPA